MHTTDDEKLFTTDNTIIEVELNKQIKYLLLNTDWRLLNKISLSDIEMISSLLTKYILGETDDKIYSYSSNGVITEHLISDFLAENELDIRSIAIINNVDINKKITACLLYFRYCYDNNEYMEWKITHNVLQPIRKKELENIILKLTRVMLFLENKYSALEELHISKFNQEKNKQYTVP